MSNYFELFDLPVAFEIDQNLLAQRYREAQRSVHPDNFASAPDRERRLSMEKTAELNDAFQTLKQPVSRGRYLLVLKGMAVNDHIGVMDIPFLMEQMELRETLANLPERADAPEALASFLSLLEQRMERLTAKLGQHFQAQELEQAQYGVCELQFFKRLHEEALALEETLQ
jgi:molecular chaperone HscB